jgi:flagellar secretion chaperone FliS
MSYAMHTGRYVENDVLSRSPEWLVPLLYEHLLGSLRRAEVQIEAGDLEGKAASLARATEIVLELNASLDREKGGEIASQLASLYSYFALEIMNVGRSLDRKVLGRLLELVAELHEAWTQAAEQVAPRGRLAGTQLRQATA